MRGASSKCFEALPVLTVSSKLLGEQQVSSKRVDEPQIPPKRLEAELIQIQLAVRTPTSLIQIHVGFLRQFPVHYWALLGRDRAPTVYSPNLADIDSSLRRKVRKTRPTMREESRKTLTAVVQAELTQKHEYYISDNYLSMSSSTL